MGCVNTGADQAVAGILSSTEGSVCIGTVECSQWGQGKMAFIIRGDEWIDENETCWIWRSYGMEVMDGQIVYRNVLNLRQDGTYLVFLNSNQLNAYRTEKEFQTASEYFGYLPIAGAEVQPIKENQRNVLYKEWSEIPVFIST